MAAAVLRIATMGSVDDGKSTLIGRLLYDSKAIFADQLDAVQAASLARGQLEPDLALLTDGLRAEREQGITIDVAYRYFATPRRRFIIADTPGHTQYTRNMVTGASTADVALVLIDARHGVVEQSRRHAFLASLLRVPHMVLCVNKMDLVDYAQDRFAAVRDEFQAFAAKLEVPDLTCIPIAALTGENIVTRSPAMPWHEGPPLLTQLEELHTGSDANLIDTRLPVQYVIRSHRDDFRGYAGTVASGAVRPGDPIVVLPSGSTTTVTRVWGPGGTRLAEAASGQAVTVELADDLDIGRGDMICRPDNRPHIDTCIDATVCWMSADGALAPGGRFLLQHTTRVVRATVEALNYRLEVDTLHRDETAPGLVLNDIGRIRLRTYQPLLFDPYGRNRQTGSFILVDEATNSTVAAGMILGPGRRSAAAVTWHHGRVTRAQRPGPGLTVWLTGLPSSGKSTLAFEVERHLVASGRAAYVLDGDNLRHGLNADLGFSAADRAENVRRVGEVARLLADAGMVALVALVSPYAADRARVRQAHEAADLPFLEVFVDTPLADCEGRDPKGLYARARAGTLATFTGVSDPYERPTQPDLRLRPSDGDVAAQAGRVLELIEAWAPRF